MFQSLLFSSEPLTVSALTTHVKALLETDDVLADVRVTGEVSNVARPASGHLYFTLKDSTAQIKCVMWKSQVVRMHHLPRQGDAVTVRGRVSVYERDGAYQLYADSLAPVGTGDLHSEFERLKAALEAEGLFDSSRKRALPAFPHVVGLVTSPMGAALQDILNVLRRRCALIEVVLAPTLVQGGEAPGQIVRALQALNELDELDVILVARGGGSLEELWAFNDERVVRAVAESRVPVVSGVGHEIDFTLTDFAADMRAPTPSAAAELVSPDVSDLRQSVDALTQGLRQAVLDQLQQARDTLDTQRRALRMVSPLAQVLRARERVHDRRARLDTALLGLLELQHAQVRGLAGRLNNVGPQSTLARGYAIVQRQRDGAVVRSVQDVQLGDELTIRVSDGEFHAQA
jgi:exodeoxyribonuclease VII large subunit